MARATQGAFLTGSGMDSVLKSGLSRLGWPHKVARSGNLREVLSRAALLYHGSSSRCPLQKRARLNGMSSPLSEGLP
jgi:hypothetical protein